jgi:hypothetical protein
MSLGKVTPMARCARIQALQHERSRRMKGGRNRHNEVETSPSGLT